MRKIILAICTGLLFGFIFGVTLGKGLPSTIFNHPVLIYQAYKLHPIGSKVYPIEENSVENFENFGWYPKKNGGEPAVVVDYETMHWKDEVFLLYQIRTMDGRGYILSINEHWIQK